MPEIAATNAQPRILRRAAAALLGELQQLGFEPLLHDDSSPASGIALRVSIRNALLGGVYSVRFLAGLTAMIRRKLPVCLSLYDLHARELHTLHDVDDEHAATDAWRQFCEFLQRGLRASDVETAGIGMCVQSHQLPLDFFQEVADAKLGAGPRYVFLDSLQMEAHCNHSVQARTDANWTALWRGRLARVPLMPVYGGIVRSTCALLAEQVAMSLTPSGGLLSPAQSAWLPIRLSLPRFADCAGNLDGTSLRHALREGVPLADELLDCLHWASPQQRHDATENRRLAFLVAGLGDLVVQRGDDPADINCLRRLGETILQIRRELQAASSTRARHCGALPALSAAGAAASRLNGPQRATWQRHFDIAVRKSAVRNRNLLVLSPYSVLPSAPTCLPAFTDLLPLIAHADAWSFTRPPACSGWDVADYRNFHRRARAVIQGSNGASFIAAEV